jgi:hypothetical protein
MQENGILYIDYVLLTFKVVLREALDNQLVTEAGTKNRAENTPDDQPPKLVSKGSRKP